MKRCKHCNTENVNSAKFCRSCGKILIEGQESTEKISHSNSDTGLGDGAKIFLGILCFIGIIVFIGLFWAGSISRPIALGGAMGCGLGLQQLFKD